MDIHINWVAVLVAVIVSLILAKTWYAESLLGGPWRKLTGVTSVDSRRAGVWPMVITLFSNIATVLTLAALLDMSARLFNGASILLALAVSVVVWLAFSATTLLTHNTFERKPDRLTLINNGYQFMLFVLSGLCISLFGA